MLQYGVQRLHWIQGHQKQCKTHADWCPTCGEDACMRLAGGAPCERYQDTVYSSALCLNRDYIDHIHCCPLVTGDTKVARATQQTRNVDECRTSGPVLLQPVETERKKYVLVDDEDMIAKVKHERWGLGRKQQQVSEEEEQDAAKCEEARDRVIEWCAIHNPRFKWESWRASEKSAKIVTECCGGKLVRKIPNVRANCGKQLSASGMSC